MQSEEYFYCYNRKLSAYLHSKGIRYIHKAKEINTDNIFSCYKVTTELSEALNQYKQLNK